MALIAHGKSTLTNERPYDAQEVQDLDRRIDLSHRRLAVIRHEMSRGASYHEAYAAWERLVEEEGEERAGAEHLARESGAAS